MGKQLEIFPDLYPDQWVCEICNEDTHEVNYDYLGSGYNHLKCELQLAHEKEECSTQQPADWPGLDSISKEWV